MILVLFGVPGAGKSFAGHLLARDFGIRFHDADHELPADMRHALATKQPVTDAMRAVFFERVMAVTDALAGRHAELTIAQAFVRERHRRDFLERFPAARFVLVRSQPALIAERFALRHDYLIDLEDALTMARQFEAPGIPHRVIDNTAGETALRAQLDALLANVRTDRR